MNLEYQAFLCAKSKHRSDLVEDVRELWEALTRERAEQLSTYFRKPGLRRAYLGYYLPLYAKKIENLLRGLKISFEAPRVLDLGAGPLSGTLGALLAYENLGHVTAVDRDLGPMRAGLEFLESMSIRPAQIQLKQANLKGPPNYWKPNVQPDIIVMAHVLNEFGFGPRHIEDKQKLIFQALKLLSPRGVLLLVEPATRMATRDLMMLRDGFYASGEVSILAPCPNVAQCPLLVEKNNWCHVEIPHQRHPELQKIDLKIGFEREFLKCSYLALSPRPSSRGPGDTNWISGQARDDSSVRVVSGLMRANGILRRYVCTPEGLKTLSQKETEPNAILPKLFRGEVLDVSKIQGQKIRMHQES